VRALWHDPTRNNRGIAHENGAIESAHDAYRCFIEEIVARKNRRNAVRIPLFD